jgi:hypothetical protein
LRGAAVLRCNIMKAAGVCWRMGGWILSVYKRLEDPYPTLKVRRLKVDGNR